MKVIQWLLIETLFVVTTYAELVEGVEGAQNIVMFYVWAFCLPLALLSWRDDVRSAVAKNAQTPTFMTAINLVINLTALAALIWEGWIYTAIAWSLVMGLMAAFRDDVRRLRKEAQAQ